MMSQVHMSKFSETPIVCTMYVVILQIMEYAKSILEELDVEVYLPFLVISTMYIHRYSNLW
jgi:hypothetical protein